MIKIVEAIIKKEKFFLEVTENTKNLNGLAGDIIGPFDSRKEAREYARQFLVPLNQMHDDDKEFFTKLSAYGGR